MVRGFPYEYYPGEILTEEQARENREMLVMYLGKFPRYIKRQTKTWYIYGMFTLSASLTLAPSAAVVLPLLPPPTSVHRLYSMDRSKVNSNSNTIIFASVINNDSITSEKVILKLRAGGNGLDEEKIEKLIQSIIAKSPQSLNKEMSLNKFLKKILEVIDPVISDQRFWTLVGESQKPIKSKLSGPIEVRSTDILGPAQNAPGKQAKVRSKGSFIFAEALSNPQPRRKSSSLSTIEKTRLTMAQTSKEDSFSNELTPSGLSVNHEKFNEKIQFVEKLTRLRRAEPLYSSEVLGESFQYSQKQLEIKASRHLQKDFGVSIEGKTIEEMAAEYHDCIENLLQQPNLVIRKDGKLSKQEPTINIGDPKSRKIVSFENNPLYDKNHFVSSYEIKPEAFDSFEVTGNIGLSPAEKKVKTDELQKIQAKTEREQENASSLYSNLPNDAKISNRQLDEFEMLQEQLKTDSNFQLSDKQKNLSERAEKYLQHKQEFSKNNPKVFDDEL